MSVFTGAALFVFGLLNLVSVATDIVGLRKGGGSGTKESIVVHRRRLWLRLGVGVLIVGGALAIVCFGPLRPVHEWIR
jgi:hypothetical protein